MRHKDIWRGIDQLAAHHGLTPSGLARRAGLDPTAFNPSKREGDRVVAKTTGGEVMAKVLERKNSRTIALASLNPDYPVREFKPSEIAWIARILWASQ